MLRAQRERILILAGHAVLRRHVLSGLAHRVGAIPLLHLRIHEAPAEAGVEELHITRKRCGAFRQHERGARHALNAAGDIHVTVTRFNGACGAGHGVEA